MDLVERITQALSQAISIEQIKLDDDDGVIGYVVSPDFDGMEFVDRQMKIQRALRGGSLPLSLSELRRIGAIAALTPDEFLVWSA